MSTEEPVYEVVWPLGRFISPPVAPAPALNDLNGKTICELWDHVFRGDQIYDALNAELRQRFPRVNIVGWKELGNTNGNDAREYVAKLPELLRQHGCDAVISAVGA
jgi:hypothetical protein